MIPYGRQDIQKRDIKAVKKVLKSDFLTQGDKVPKFENRLAQTTGAKYAIAVTNATSALHITYLGLGLKAGDILWTTPITFLATANAALYIGAKVKFIDIDADSFNLCPKKLAHELEKAEKNNGLPKIISLVHMAGNSCAMQQIKQLADKYNIKIVEDAAHALGGEYQNSKIGLGVYSHACVFSFHPVKIITTGEGGVITTNDTELAEKLRLLRSHGVSRTNTPKNKPWLYEQLELGFNYRMTDIQAALGISQLKGLNKIIAKRNKIAKKYLRDLQPLVEKYKIALPKIDEQNLSSWHLFIIRLQNAEQRQAVFNYLRRKNIGVNVHYIPLPMQPYYKNLGFNMEDLPNAKAFYATCITLPLYPKLKSQQIKYIIARLEKALKKYPGDNK